MNLNDYEGFSIKPHGGDQPAKEERKPAAGLAPPPEYSISSHSESNSKPNVSTSDDVRQALVSKGARGLASIPGMLGDIPAMFGVEQYRPPTTEEYMNKVKTAFPSAKEALEYEPQTPYGRYAGSVAEFLPGAVVPGGGLKLGMRAIGSTGAGVGSQFAEDLSRNRSKDNAGTWQEGVGKLAGALAGGMSATGVAKKVAPAFQFADTRAANRLAEATARDMAAGNAKKSMDFIVDNDLAPAVAGGPRTEKLLQQAASKAGDDAVGSYNDAAKEFRKEAPGKVEGTLEGIFGKPVQALDEREAMKQNAKAVNNANYDRVMNLPEAKAIPHDQLRDLAKAMPNGLFSEIMDQYRMASVNPAELGLVKMPKGGWGIPTSGASLRFWDDVKKGIDSRIRKNFDSETFSVKPGFEAENAVLTKLKNNLTDRLDLAVGDYKKIRSEASTLFGGIDALDDGRRFFLKSDDAKLHALKKQFNSLDPQQKHDFAYGFSGAYVDALRKDPVGALGMLSGRKSGFNEDKIRFALGKADADRLIGSIHSEHLNRSIQDLIPGSRDYSSYKAGAAGILGGAATSIASNLESVMQGLTYSNSLPAIVSAISLGAVSAGGKALLNARERKTMENVLRIASDPSQAQRLGKLVAENQEARGVLAKVYQQAARSAPGAFSDTDAPPLTVPGSRTGRKAGGRITPHEVEADRLIMAAERAKKRIGQKTQSILERPDEIVVQALKRANDAIET